jgi:hypothetical protein
MANRVLVNAFIMLLLTPIDPYINKKAHTARE